MLALQYLDDSRALGTTRATRTETGRNRIHATEIAIKARSKRIGMGAVVLRRNKRRPPSPLMRPMPLSVQIFAAGCARGQGRSEYKNLRTHTWRNFLGVITGLLR
jgi:hypothetical protein